MEDFMPICDFDLYDSISDLLEVDVTQLKEELRTYSATEIDENQPTTSCDPTPKQSDLTENRQFGSVVIVEIEPNAHDLKILDNMDSVNIADVIGVNPLISYYDYTSYLEGYDEPLPDKSYSPEPHVSQDLEPEVVLCEPSQDSSSETDEVQDPVDILNILEAQIQYALQENFSYQCRINYNGKPIYFKLCLDVNHNGKSTRVKQEPEEDVMPNSCQRGRMLRVHPIDLNPPESMIIASCGITSSEKILVKMFCDEFKFVYTDSKCETYSVLVFKAGTCVDSHPFKYFVALASKADIVSMEWVIQSLKANCILPLQLFGAKESEYAWRKRPLLHGITIITQLLMESDYPDPQQVLHLLNMTGGRCLESLSHITDKTPHPRFILFNDESQLTSKLLNLCSQFSTMAISFQWIQDSLEKGKQLPVDDYLSLTFSKSSETFRMYNVPDRLQSPEQNEPSTSSPSSSKSHS